MNTSSDSSQISSKFAIKLAKSLFESPQDQSCFLESMSVAQECQALIWLQDPPTVPPFPVLTPLSWQPSFVSRIDASYKPGADDLHKQGAYYVLDFASVFMASALLPLVSSGLKPSLIFDSCSSPGGKAVLAWRLLHPDFLICNEVIGKRLGALISNLQRCKLAPVWVLNADLSRIAAQATSCADVVIVDAPCSGQSLWAKGKKSPGGFHPSTINLCANRQKRIMANAAKIVAPNGYLAYMTCTYSREENEGVVEWLLKRFPEFSACEVTELAEFKSHLSDFPAYRLWPAQGLGAGGFCVLLKRTSAGESGEFNLGELRVAWATKEGSE